MQGVKACGGVKSWRQTSPEATASGTSADALPIKSEEKMWRLFEVQRWGGWTKKGQFVPRKMFHPIEVWLTGGNFTVTLNTGCHVETTEDGQPQMWITIGDSLCRCVSAFHNPQINSSNYSTTPDETLLLGNSNYKQLFKIAEMLNGLNK